MSILIKGMEMPKTCRKCGFYHHSVDDGYYDFEYCGANNKEFNNAYDSTKPHINPFEEKLSTCPLVPVPPHGRWNNIIQGIIPSGQCSNCGAWDKVTRFCPNCGSRMEDE